MKGGLCRGSKNDKIRGGRCDEERGEEDREERPKGAAGCPPLALEERTRFPLPERKEAKKRAEGSRLGESTEPQALPSSARGPKALSDGSSAIRKTALHSRRI